MMLAAAPTPGATHDEGIVGCTSEGDVLCSGIPAAPGALVVPQGLLAGHQLLETVQCLRPALFVKRTPPLGGKHPLINHQVPRFAQIPKRERDDRLPIIRVRILPPERGSQAPWRVDLTKLS